jgi:hypothetical protein
MVPSPPRLPEPSGNGLSDGLGAEAVLERIRGDDDFHAILLGDGRSVFWTRLADWTVVIDCTVETDWTAKPAVHPMVALPPDSAALRLHNAARQRSVI